MRILIDECIDERFRNSLPGHDCQTARYAGLAGLKNGDLLAAAETADFFFRFRSCESVGLHREESLFSFPISSF